LSQFLLANIRALGEYTRVYLAGALSMYFVMDTIGSSKALINFKAFVVDFAHWSSAAERSCHHWSLTPNACPARYGIY